MSAREPLPSETAEPSGRGAEAPPAGAEPSGRLVAPASTPAEPAGGAAAGAAGGAAPTPPLAPITRMVDEDERRKRLHSMKRNATGMLVAAAVVFVITRLLEARSPWLGYIRATAEASMVGGLADWFAVTALFKHPLGIPIPHTAIIPERKDRIGRALGGFVQNNFLSRDVVRLRLTNLHPAEKIARWLSNEDNARRVAHHAAAGLAGAAHVLRDEDIQAFIEKGLVSRLRKVHVAHLLSNMLSVLTADGRHQDLLDAALRGLDRAIEDNEEVIRRRIGEETPRWFPEWADEKIHEKLVGAVQRLVDEVAHNPDHELRRSFDEAVAKYIEDLRHSPAAIARVEAIKEDVLTHPAVGTFAGSIWSEAKEALLKRAAEADSEGKGSGAVERAVMAIGKTILNDPAVLAKVDEWILESVLYAVEEYRGEVAALIEHTVNAWDPKATSEKIELQVGRDLQFIRINGTLVGGLVGLLLYALSKLV